MAGSDEGQAQPRIDLETVRETLAYMHDDMQGVPGLSRVRHALGTAIAEIKAAEGGARTVAPAPLRLVAGTAVPHFVPWTPRG